MDVPVVYSYDEFHRHIQDGDIIFVRNRPSTTAWIIRIFTKSVYSHVGIAFWMETASVRRLMMVEAQGGASRRIVNMSMYSDQELDVIKAPKPWGLVLKDALSRISQVPYAWMEAVYVGIVEAFLKYFDVQLPRKNFRGEICSEFVAKMYELPSLHVSPQGLMDELIELKYEERVQLRKQA